MTQNAQLVHAVFTQETSRQSNFAVWERAYVDFLSKGYTCDDLRLVLRFIARENRRMNGAAFSLRQNKLFDFEYMHFDALLQEARAKDRNARKAKTESEKTLARYENAIEPEEADPRIRGAGRHVSELFRNIAQ